MDLFCGFQSGSRGFFTSNLTFEPKSEDPIAAENILFPSVWRVKNRVKITRG